MKISENSTGLQRPMAYYAYIMSVSK